VAPAGTMPAAAEPTPPELARCRRRIDHLDRCLLELLNRRAELAKEIARLKQAAGIAVFAPQREASLVEELVRRSRGPLPPQAVRAVFREVIGACRHLQEPLTVACLGPAHTFSHQAARSRFGRLSRLLAVDELAEVFAAVERGRAQVGVVPVENSWEGGVGQALDLLAATPLRLCGEILLPVRHALAAATPRLEEVRVVYSHPQALAQCRAWLDRHLPLTARVPTPSTAAAVERAAAEPGAAAVASEEAAHARGLTILAQAIQDQPHNATRFLVLGRQDCPPTGNDKTSLVFTLPHRPGTLHRALEPLARAGLNLTRIESRPTRQRPWEYVFFLDFLGHRAQEPAAGALAELSECVLQLRVLGSYPAAEGLPPGDGHEHH